MKKNRKGAVQSCVAGSTKEGTEEPLALGL